MNLEYISKKIENIINSADNPLHKDFYFYVATDGFYLDSVADLSMKKTLYPFLLVLKAVHITLFLI